MRHASTWFFLTVAVASAAILALVSLINWQADRLTIEEMGAKQDSLHAEEIYKEEMARLRAQEDFNKGYRH